jgi:hypothetical protein
MSFRSEDLVCGSLIYVLLYLESSGLFEMVSLASSNAWVVSRTCPLFYEESYR